MILGPSGLDDAQIRSEMKDRLSALELYMRRRAREDFLCFLEYAILDEGAGVPLEVQWFQEEWSAAMDGSPRLLILAPRNHGKSTIMVARIVWELGRDPNLRIKIVCAADGKAKERLFEIKQLIESPRVMQVFPGLRQDTHAEWSKHKLHVVRRARHRDASIEAMSVLSTVTGGRADLLIADDVVDRRNSLALPKLCEHVKQAWRADFSNLVEPGKGRIWGIATLWKRGDLNHELMDNKAYHTLFYAVDDRFGSLWPTKWSELDLKARYDEIGSIEFARGFKNKPSDESSAPIRPQDIVFRDLGPNVISEEEWGRMICFTSYDTAKGEKMHNDYTACVVIAVDPDSRLIYVTDAWHDRLSLDKRASRIFSDYRNFSPDRIFIESVGQSETDSHLLVRYPELNGIVVPVRPKSSKYERLIAITPLLERGQVIFSDRLDPESDKFVLGRGNLVEELLDFGIAEHDDLADAFSQALSEGARKYLLDPWAPGLQREDDYVPSPMIGGWDSF